MGARESWQYARVLQILDEYWLSEPDEEYVRVDMYFRKKDGAEQKKTILWRDDGKKKGKKFYAVKNGRHPGIYKSWDECNREVNGFAGARFHSFDTMTEAKKYMEKPLRMRRLAEYEENAE